ncbi:MAG: endolytic transglycosylase MltG, partial [Christensenellales bacterium]
MTGSNGENRQAFENNDAFNETKAFEPIGSQTDNERVLEDGRDEFIINDDTKEPLDRCEQRGSFNTVRSVVWRVMRPMLILIISAALLVYFGFAAYHYFEESYFLPVDTESAVLKTVEIKTGSSLSTISSLLYDKEIIKNKFVFQMYVDFNDMASSLVAGTYSLSPSMTMDEIVDILARGDGGREIIKLTFTEGMTAVDMADNLVKKGIFNEGDKQQFLALCNMTAIFSEYDFIEILKETADRNGRRYLLEGYLFPDTYEFYKDAKPKDVIKKLLTRFDQVFTVEYEDRAQEIGMTVDQVIALASMIEWEAQNQDFKKVSAVFHNRLAIEMQLQSCATLRYVTGEKKLSYTKEEINIDSPYNTYLIAGLPIGPVANPGKKAIEAALYP